MRSARPTHLLAVLFTAIPTLLAFPGCTKTVEAPAASRLSIVQGHLQQAPAGTLLPTPIVLRVHAADGAPIANIPVSFNVLAGGGSVDPATAKSDANGEVKARWTLGAGQQVQTVVGSAPGVEPITLGALGVLASDITLVQGNNQTAKANAALPVQLVFRVTGANSMPIPGQTVALIVTSGGGSLSPQSAVTNALGEVAVRWTLGPQLGLQTATASSGSIGPVTITAVAN
ncbi:Ig-like domain-containing protein [Gemmatimonas sp.]|jgi:hypothetical protein|uniref:Ig-like domain-containing protein n=1 Tax=Gemmatimonas sp. TaxID=1962908 RepID=UPI0031C3B162|nr:hypothetical protein [Gemmatimonas sp.]